ncbi:hypothetical protein GGH99_007497, partial [Coemansia sp. RSA 1285]
MSVDSASPAEVTGPAGVSGGMHYDFEDAQSGDLGALAAIADAMKSDSLADRLESLKRLSVLALAMGEERTRDELIP